MLTIRVDSVRLEDGNVILHPITPKEAYKLTHTLKPGKLYDCEIKPHRGRRSNDANAYCWKLCELIAESIGGEKEEVYRQSIREVGVYKQFSLPESQARTLEKVWGKQGIGWLTERVDYDGGNILLNAYYGSSTYNTKQMSRLLDNLIQDCQALGIETLPPDEVARLKSLWEAGNE